VASMVIFKVEPESISILDAETGFQLRFSI
jgi:hypothetical protein